MAQLPKRFQSWLKFWAWLQYRADFSSDTTTFIFDNVVFEVQEVKARCFDELIMLIPSKDKMAYCARKLALNSLPIEDADWLITLVRSL